MYVYCAHKIKTLSEQKRHCTPIQHWLWFLLGMNIFLKIGLVFVRTSLSKFHNKELV